MPEDFNAGLEFSGLADPVSEGLFRQAHQEFLTDSQLDKWDVTVSRRELSVFADSLAPDGHRNQHLLQSPLESSLRDFLDGEFRAWEDRKYPAVSYSVISLGHRRVETLGIALGTVLLLALAVQPHGGFVGPAESWWLLRDLMRLAGYYFALRELARAITRKPSAPIAHN